MKKSTRVAQAAAAAALLVAGAGAGFALGLGGSASADTSTGSSTSSSTQPDQSKSQRSDEKLLTGTTAEKVRAAAMAKYPGATIQRVETDSDGVYEAHVVTKAGDDVIVQVDKSFAVTGTQTGGGHGGGHGDHDGDGPDASQQQG